MFDDYDRGDEAFLNDPNPNWFCANCGLLFDEDELNEDNLCPDCAEEADN